MIEQQAMFNADMIIVIAFLVASLYWKEQRTSLIVCAVLYLFFSLFWHLYPWAEYTVN